MNNKPKVLTWKTALRTAREINTCVHLEGDLIRVRIAKAALKDAFAGEEIYGEPDQWGGDFINFKVHDKVIATFDTDSGELLIG